MARPSTTDRDSFVFGCLLRDMLQHGEVAVVVKWPNVTYRSAGDETDGAVLYNMFQELGSPTSIEFVDQNRT